MNGFAEDTAPAYEPPPMTKAAFCRWIETQNARYEWKDGRIVQMTNVTRAHARVVSNIIVAFAKRLNPDHWTVVASDFGVETGDAIRYPDVVVEKYDSDGKSTRSHNPVILVEVLSPSSIGIDMTEKSVEYTTFPSLQAYIVANQDAAILYVWQRDVATKTFTKIPQQISGLESTVTLDATGISLPLAEIYRGIV